jgi:hypothetical protein
MQSTGNMSNKALIILGMFVAGIVIIVGTIWYLRGRDAGVPLYNPFTANQTRTIETEPSVPSDYSTPEDGAPIPAPEVDPSIIEPITVPPSLLE